MQMKKKRAIRNYVLVSLFIVVVMVLCFVSFPVPYTNYNFLGIANLHLGLELGGGVKNTYQLEVADWYDGTNDQAYVDAVNRVQKLLDKHYADAKVYLSGEDEITMEVPDTSISDNLIVGFIEMKAEEHQLQAVYALSAAYRLDKEFGVSMPLVFEQQVANEMNKEQERIVFADMFNNAQGGAAVVWSSTPRPGVSDNDHVAGLPIAINLAAAKIYQATGGNLGASFILAGSNAGAYFAKTPDFKAENMPLNGGSFYLGKMGVLDVFQVPSLAPNDFLIGAKGNEY